jgi:hypothetical protein
MPELLTILITALAAIALVLILMPFLYKKFPNVFISILKVVGYKDTIKTAYYIIVDMAIKGLEKAQKDLIFSYIQSAVLLVEDLAQAGDLPKEARKAKAMEIMTEVLNKMGIFMTPAVEAMISNAIELVVTYMELRLSTPIVITE